MHFEESIPERESCLSYSEFQTTLQLAANLANEHPINAREQSFEDSSTSHPMPFCWDEHLQVVTERCLTSQAIPIRGSKKGSARSTSSRDPEACTLNEFKTSGLKSDGTCSWW